MKKYPWFFVLSAAVVFVCLSCVSGGASKRADTADADTAFDKAIESCAREIELSLDEGVSVAVVGFESGSPELSGDIMEEFMGCLIRGKKLLVADRSKLDLVYKELDLSMSGYISDETAVNIGKMVGARFVITGSLTNRGDAYRLRITAINTETAVRTAFSSVNIKK
jgi:TolB-like protein